MLSHLHPEAIAPVLRAGGLDNKLSFWYTHQVVKPFG
jgi:hypothetical protein